MIRKIPLWLRRRRRSAPSSPGVEHLRLHDIRDMDGALAFYDLALWVLLAPAHVLLDHMRPFNNDPLLLPDDGDDPAAFAFVRAGNDHRFVALFYMKCAHN